MTRLSILIASVADVAACEDTLASVLQNRPADSEVLLVHSRPYDDPYGLGEEVRFLRVARPTVCGLVAVGVEQARGEIVHLLAPGVTVEEGWTDATVKLFADRGVGSVSPLVAHSGGNFCGLTRTRFGGVATTCFVSETIGPTRRAAYYRRQAVLPFLSELESSGDELFDADLALSLAEAGWRTAVEVSGAVVDATEHVTVEHPLRDGMAAERLFWRHASAASEFAAHPFLALADSFAHGLASSLPRFLGHTAAMFEFGAAARHRRRVEEASEAREAFENENAILQFPTARSTDRGAVQPGLRRAA